VYRPWRYYSERGVDTIELELDALDSDQWGPVVDLMLRHEAGSTTTVHESRIGAGLHSIATAVGPNFAGLIFSYEAWRTPGNPLHRGALPATSSMLALRVFVAARVMPRRTDVRVARRRLRYWMGGGAVATR